MCLPTNASRCAPVRPLPAATNVRRKPASKVEKTMGSAAIAASIRAWLRRWACRTSCCSLKSCMSTSAWIGRPNSSRTADTVERIGKILPLLCSSTRSAEYPSTVPSARRAMASRVGFWSAGKIFATGPPTSSSALYPVSEQSAWFTRSMLNTVKSTISCPSDPRSNMLLYMRSPSCRPASCAASKRRRIRTRRRGGGPGVGMASTTTSPCWPFIGAPTQLPVSSPRVSGPSPFRRWAGDAREEIGGPIRAARAAA